MTSQKGMRGQEGVSREGRKEGMDQRAELRSRIKKKKGNAVRQVKKWNKEAVKGGKQP